MHPDVVVNLYGYCLVARAVEDGDGFVVDLVVYEQEGGRKGLGELNVRL